MTEATQTTFFGDFFGKEMSEISDLANQLFAICDLGCPNDNAKGFAGFRICLIPKKEVLAERRSEAQVGGGPRRGQKAAFENK